MHTLIVADVHLKVSPKEVKTRQDFARFLRSIDADSVERIFLLGDLFDFWFEYRHVVFSGFFDVLRAFADLRDRGVDLHLIVGNHDLWSGRFLEEELGFTIHQNEYRCDFGGRRTLMVHGDGINPEDRSYRLYKRVALSRWATGSFRLLHPDWAMGLAQWVSHGSRTLLAPDDPTDTPEVRALRKFAQQTAAAGDADVVICGHSHHPEELELDSPTGTGLYLNTGDWMAKRTYIEWDGHDFHRRYFE